MPKRKKPDAAAQIAKWLDDLNNQAFKKTGYRPFWLPLNVHESLQRRIRRAISAAVRSDRKARRGKR